jgi:hypothetical protein
MIRHTARDANHASELSDVFRRRTSDRRMHLVTMPDYQIYILTGQSRERLTHEGRTFTWLEADGSIGQQEELNLNDDDVPPPSDDEDARAGILHTFSEDAENGDTVVSTNIWDVQRQANIGQNYAVSECEHFERMEREAWEMGFNVCADSDDEPASSESAEQAVIFRTPSRSSSSHGDPWTGSTASSPVPKRKKN